MKKIAFLALSTCFLVMCCSSLPVHFVNEYAPPIQHSVNEEKYRVLSSSDSIFKVYALSNNNIAIIAPQMVGDSKYSTTTVDLDDINNSIIINNDDRQKLILGLDRLISLYEEDFSKGTGTIYDYSLYTNTKDPEIVKILLRIQLRIEDSNSKKPYTTISVALLNYVDNINIEQVKKLYNALSY